MAQLRYAKWFAKALIEVSMKVKLTQRETKGFVLEYAGRGIPPPKFVASVDI